MLGDKQSQRSEYGMTNPKMSLFVKDYQNTWRRLTKVFVVTVIERRGNPTMSPGF